MLALKAVFWLSLGALLWTHLLYPLGAVALARVRTRRVGKEPIEPAVAVIVAAYNEEAVIERRLENLLALDYPADRLELVVTSDASTDRTHELVERSASKVGGDRVRLIVNPRGGKVAAQNRAVRETSGEIVAFSDANATWAPDALRQLVANFADPEVAYVCGRLVLETADGSNREGLYWRYELVQREAESRLGSITGGNGSIYAVRRSDYVEVDPKWGHDLSLPYRMVQAGRRAVYEPEARAFEKPTPSNETEYRRKVRMFEHCWEITLRGSMLKRLPFGYLVEVISHRVLRYGSGILHLALLASSLALVGEGLLYQLVLAAQLALIAAAMGGRAGLEAQRRRVDERAGDAAVGEEGDDRVVRDDEVVRIGLALQEPRDGDELGLLGHVVEDDSALLLDVAGDEQQRERRPAQGSATASRSASAPSAIPAGTASTTGSTSRWL